MTPTTKLRFVERFEITERRPDGYNFGRIVHILQQWWDKDIATITGDPIGEWRDVPIEKEQT